MNHHDDTTPRDDHDGATPEPIRGDRLDELLRAWHDENRDGARAVRDALLAELERDATRGAGGDHSRREGGESPRRGVLARIGFGRMLSAAAVLAFSVLAIVLFTKNTERSAIADSGLVQVAEGGALDALDADGNTLGPCPLQHTDVKVEISGLFARTVVEQTYANPYPRTIEAIYTFPLSHRAAVDRMTMIVTGPSGEKIVEGEVKERALARAIYEEARESGYVASLLEQERPNIFTQSVANIEPGATVKVRIATLELAQRRDGVAEYVFPMVVGPRYIPGQPASLPRLPEGWEVRQGVVLRSPAGVEVAAETPFGAARLSQLLQTAIPVRAPRHESVDELLQLGEAVNFTAKYGNGSAERGTYFPVRGLGELNGRFFFAPLGAEQGTGFAGDTTQVPDASRITPMPVKPSERAGHDISVSVAIESGGPAITDVTSELHAVSVDARGASTRLVTLDDRTTIPNRDFILRWKVADAAIEPSFFTHVSASADPSVKGGYFALMLDPPARVAPAEIRPRELIFVLDVSGSMNGFPIEKSKALARKAIASMRPNDTFNFITFAGATSVLWPEPRPADEANRKLAEDFVNGAYGSGGTEMMAAINAALVQDGRSGLLPAKLLDLPADGRAVRVAVAHDALVRGGDNAWTLRAGDGRSIPVDLSIALPANPRKLALLIDGTWETRDGNRVLVTRSGSFENADARTRFVFFLTDGYIGNDQGVIAAVRENARASRVFSFGIGNSVNRFLLEEMARAGRGACEIVTLSEEADGVIERLVRRIESPVLTDIELSATDGATLADLGLRDLLPAGEHLPDLYDQEPIVLMGRFDRAARGAITVRGRTGAGPWERTIAVDLPATETRHDVVKTLWARAKVDALLGPRLAEVQNESLDAATKRAVVRLGESYSIATPYTSFVAVEKSRVVVGGKPMLVAVPVELPDGTNWAGFFGEGVRPADAFALDGGGDLSRTAGLRTLSESTELGRWFFASTPAVDELVADADSGGGTGEIVNQNAVKLELQDAASVKELDVTGTVGGGLGAPAPLLNKPAAPQDPSAMPSNRGEAWEASGVPAGVASGEAASGAKNQGLLDAVQDTKTRGVAARSRSTESLHRDGGATLGKKLEEKSEDRFDRGSSEFGRRMPGAPMTRPGAPSQPPAGAGGGGPGGSAAGGLGTGGYGGGGGTVGGLTGGSAAAPAAPPAVTAPAKAAEALNTAASTETAPDAAARLTTGAPGSDAEVTAAAARSLPTSAERDRLVRVLDRRLVLLALAELVGMSSASPEIAKDLGLVLEDGALTVAMKVAPADGATITALRALGVVIVAEDPARGLVVAKVTPANLAKIAAISGVRRVEPLEAR